MMQSEEIRSVQPFPMQVNLKGGGAIDKGEIITENVGGVDVKYKVIGIHSVRILESNGATQVVVMVRELPETKKD